MKDSDSDKLVFKDLNYNSYLKIPELLDLQRLISKPAHHDEMFFIIIHQVMELWFKLIEHETGQLIQSLRGNSISRALKCLKRMNAVSDLLAPQISLISTLTPVEFAGFRDDLNPASGFQSAGFRRFEFAYGLREDFFKKFFATIMPEVTKELEDLASKPSVFDEFLLAVHNAGFTMPREILDRDVTQTRQDPNPEVEVVIQKLYENPGENYHWVLICEALLDFDERVSRFRNNHILAVRRCIGDAKTGTGGSSGVDFLKGRANLVFFPELWSVRNRIGINYGT